jgi:hypothetical protein
MRLHVETMVPLRIHDYLKCPGGIDEQRFEYARNVLAWDIAEQGDTLLYRVKGKSAEMINKLVEGLAILSFCPGGVTFLGIHFEAADMAKRLGIPMEPVEYALEPIEEPIESKETTIVI